VLWNDIAYAAHADARELFVHYYNTVTDGVVNGRWAQDGLPVRFTSTDEAVFAIVLGTPTGARLTIKGISVADAARVELLGGDGALAWERSESGLVVTMPAPPPSSPAHALRISPASAVTSATRSR
jgi:hypothetical protein